MGRIQSEAHAPGLAELAEVVAEHVVRAGLRQPAHEDLVRDQRPGLIMLDPCTSRRGGGPGNTGIL